jgi:hypothetical protein
MINLVYVALHLGPGGEPDAEDVKLAWLAGARVIRLTPR